MSSFASSSRGGSYGLQRHFQNNMKELNWIANLFFPRKRKRAALLCIKKKKIEFAYTSSHTHAKQTWGCNYAEWLIFRGWEMGSIGSTECRPITISWMFLRLVILFMVSTGNLKCVGFNDQINTKAVIPVIGGRTTSLQQRIYNIWPFNSNEKNMHNKGIYLHYSLYVDHELHIAI